VHFGDFRKLFFSTKARKFAPYYGGTREPVVPAYEKVEQVNRREVRRV